MSIILALILLFTDAHTAYAAVAISSCESGDGWNFGTYDWTARSETADGGAFQFNDSTWDWLVGTGQGDTASPLVQTKMFIVLYDDANGLYHWSSSRPCWSRWITDDGSPVNNEHYYNFVGIYYSLQSERLGAKQ